MVAEWDALICQRSPTSSEARERKNEKCERLGTKIIVMTSSIGFQMANEDSTCSLEERPCDLREECFCLFFVILSVGGRPLVSEQCALQDDNIVVRCSKQVLWALEPLLCLPFGSSSEYEVLVSRYACASVLSNTIPC